jgi:hypothetical protein
VSPTPAGERSPLATALELLAQALDGPTEPELLARFLEALLPAVPGAVSAGLGDPHGAPPAGSREVDREAGGTQAWSLPLPGGGSVRFALTEAAPPVPQERAAEVAAACAVAVRAIALRTRVANLEVGLSSSRQIAAAVGIVMAQRLCGYDEAFDLLRAASQRTNRKVRELADEVLFTGALPGPAADPGAAAVADG